MKSGSALKQVNVAISSRFYYYTQTKSGLHKYTNIFGNVISLKTFNKTVILNEQGGIANKSQASVLNKYYTYEKIALSRFGKLKYDEINSKIAPYTLSEYLDQILNKNNTNLDISDDIRTELLEIAKSFNVPKSRLIKFEYVSRNPSGVRPLEKLLCYNLVRQPQNYTITVSESTDYRAILSELGATGLYKITGVVNLN